jgi:hypothetical protein
MIMQSVVYRWLGSGAAQAVPPARALVDQDLQANGGSFFRGSEEP